MTVRQLMILINTEQKLFGNNFLPDSQFLAAVNRGGGSSYLLMTGLVKDDEDGPVAFAYLGVASE